MRGALVRFAVFVVMFLLRRKSVPTNGWNKSVVRRLNHPDDCHICGSEVFEPQLTDQVHA